MSHGFATPPSMSKLRYHIIGIAGIGMSGLAMLMAKRGYTVSGSDLQEGETVSMLRTEGIKVYIGHDPNNVVDAECLVVSSAIKEDNVELSAAKSAGKPVMSRAELLGGLMHGDFKTICISGSHGKTTTTTMVGSIMRAANMRPTIICGGIMHEYGTNMLHDHGEWMIVEADESDGTCCKLPRCDISIVTNISDEHGNNLGGYEGIKNTFREFVNNTKGPSVLCADDHNCASMARSGDMTYGIDNPADIMATNIIYDNNGTTFDVKVGDNSMTCTLRMPGRHNALNALGAIAACTAVGIAQDFIIRGLEQCMGAKRRFDKIAEVGGITLYDDYAHHHNEVKAILDAARHVAGTGRVIAVVQPHRFSRLISGLHEFAKALCSADAIGIMDVYPAGEDAHNFNNISSLDLITAMAGKALHTPDAQAITNLIKNNASNGDVVIFMGAGDITKVARSVANNLKSAHV